MWRANGVDQQRKTNMERRKVGREVGLAALANSSGNLPRDRQSHELRMN